MIKRIQIRRDTSANWTLDNPTLYSGELGFELDTSLLKIGDGVTTWNNLSYYASLPFSALDSDITPSSTSTYDLGSASNQWRQIHVDEGFYIGDIKLSNVSGQLQAEQVTDAGTSNEEVIPNTNPFASILDAYQILPTDAQGYLFNTGTGTLSWAPSLASSQLINGTSNVTLSPFGELAVPGNITSGSLLQLSGQSVTVTTTQGPDLSWQFLSTGDFVLPSGGSINSADQIQITVDPQDSTVKTWTFNNLGVIELPNNTGTIGQNQTDTQDLEINYADGVTIRTSLGSWRFNNSTGTIDFPNGSTFGPVNGTSTTGIVADTGDNVVIKTSTDHQWQFTNIGGFEFPDGTVQTTAYKIHGINVDGGGASSVYEIVEQYADGGFASTQHGSIDPVYSGGNAPNTIITATLNGGGA